MVFAPLRGWYVRSRMVRRRDPVFAPLRGWYMMAMLWAQEIMAFAPYGDGTVPLTTPLQKPTVSPPYGEGTVEWRGFFLRHFVFAPVRGEPSQSRLTPCQLPRKGSLVQGNGSCKSSPFRGSWRAAPERVLRGEVEIWYKDFDGMAKKFLSPYGDGTYMDGITKNLYPLSPPYGDGTAKPGTLPRIIIFSPPYGDSTCMNPIWDCPNPFSPPYGDGTE